MSRHDTLDRAVEQRRFAFWYACGCGGVAVALLIASAFGIERVEFAAGMMLGLTFQGLGAHMLLGQIATLQRALAMRKIMTTGVPGPLYFVAKGHGFKITAPCSIVADRDVYLEVKA